jgi:hypothetical protein
VRGRLFSSTVATEAHTIEWAISMNDGAIRSSEVTPANPRH